MNNSLDEMENDLLKFSAGFILSFSIIFIIVGITLVYNEIYNKEIIELVRQEDFKIIQVDYKSSSRVNFYIQNIDTNKIYKIEKSKCYHSVDKVYEGREFKMSVKYFHTTRNFISKYNFYEEEMRNLFCRK